MDIDNRDQVSCHGVLKAVREKNGWTLKNVAMGVCSVSLVQRTENGYRVPEKLVRDRIAARLGISSRQYEEYLQPKEYSQWKQRQSIIKAIERKEIETIEKELEEYSKMQDPDGVQMQFVEAIRFILLQLKDAPLEEQRTCIDKAVALTVPDVEAALTGLHLLADQELNLIVEQIRLKEPEETVEDKVSWRLSQYQQIISYMDHSKMGNLAKVRVYPKTVYYICSLLLSRKPDFEELQYGLELCRKAMGLLRDTRRLNYFVEISECSREFAGQIEKSNHAKSNSSTYIDNFCYLYYENECHNAAKVIEKRRNMLGLSRMKLSNGVCADKTIVRIEREGKSPSLFIVRDLLGKMGMYPEYISAQVVTSDVDLLILAEATAENANRLEFAEMEHSLYVLEDGLDMDIPQNQQEIKRLHAILDYRRKWIDKEAFGKQMIEALECTLPVSALTKKGEKYLTRNEMACVCELAFRTEGEMADACMKILEQYKRI